MEQKIEKKNTENQEQKKTSVSDREKKIFLIGYAMGVVEQIAYPFLTEKEKRSLDEKLVEYLTS